MKVLDLQGETRTRLTLSGRGRHCRTCKVRRRTRRWPAGRSWCAGGRRGRGRPARHAAAASSPPASRAHRIHADTARSLPTATPALSDPVSPLAARRNAAAATGARRTVRERGIHFLAALCAHARGCRAVAPPACTSARLASPT